MPTTTHPLKFIALSNDANPAHEDIHVASVVIQCQPRHQNSIEDYCRSKVGYHIYTDDKRGTLVLVFETCAERDISKALDNLNNTNGVINASLVYHHCEPRHSLEEDMSS